MSGPFSRTAGFGLLLAALSLIACSSEGSKPDRGEDGQAKVDAPPTPTGDAGDARPGDRGVRDGSPSSGQPPGSVSVLDHGAVGDGSHDDTGAFRSATGTGKTVWVPRPPAYYKITGTIWLKGSMVGDMSQLDKLPRIVMVGSTGYGDKVGLLVRDWHGAQLTVAGLQVEGTYTSGPSQEWDHNIAISLSENVRVTNCRLLDARGDSVQIGEWKRPTDGKAPNSMCKNILVENSSLQNPYRCTVAPIGLDGGSIRNNFLRKINRVVGDTNIPSIDIEPEVADYTNNLTIESNVVDNHTSEVHVVWFVQAATSHVPAWSNIRAKNNRGYWPGLSNDDSAFAENTNNVSNNNTSWTMAPFVP